MTTLTQTSSPLARIGRVWFRWRGFSPVPFFVLFLVLPSQVNWGWGAVAVLLSIAIAAEGARIWTVGYMGSATRTRGDGVPALVHAGPLRYVRNPLYIANAALYTVVGLLMGHVTLSLVFLAYTALQYTCIVAFEEERLLTIFGSPYAVYQSQVPRWLVAFSPRCRPSAHTFDLKRAIKSESSTFVVISVVFLAFAVKRTFL
jgi:protein-S-isoprenylcysteine O-methyltransferase Ste14